jgi:hypothetical protein
MDEESGAAGGVGASPIASPSRGGLASGGLKLRIEEIAASHAALARTVAAQGAELQALREARDAAGRAAEEAVRAAVKELRVEWFAKLQTLATRVEGLERDVATQRGDANVLAQQNKDTARYVSLAPARTAPPRVQTVACPNSCAEGSPSSPITFASSSLRSQAVRPQLIPTSRASLDCGPIFSASIGGRVLIGHRVTHTTHTQHTPSTTPHTPPLKPLTSTHRNGGVGV